MDRPRCLLAFTSTHGNTRWISERMTTGLRGRFLDVVAVDLTREQPTPDGFDLVVAGGSVHMDHHAPELLRWIRTHEAALADRPVALFSVSLEAAGDATDHRQKVADYLQELRDLVPGAATVAPLAGALQYREYALPTRWMMRRIARRHGLSTDTHEDHRFTDVADVDAFVTSAAELVAAPVR